MKILPVIIVLILLFSSSDEIYGQEVDVTKLPGYVDLERIEIPTEAEDITDINVGSSLLKMAADSKENGDSKLSALLSQIYAVRVKSFEIDDETTATLRPHIEQIQQELESEKWERIVYVKSGDEMVTVSVKHDNEKIAGLMFIAFEPGSEVVLANIVGDFDLAALTGLVLGFSDGELEEILEDLDSD